MKNNSIKPIKRLSFRDEVYQTLKQAIITLEFQPEERLHDKELAERFGISRTPVREALKRLEDEGLVEAIPGSATRVAPLYIEEAKHSFTVVAALHALATRLAAAALNEKDFKQLVLTNQQLETAIKNGNVLEAIEADEEFHLVFLNRAQNPELIRALAQCISKVHRLEISQFSSAKSLQSVEQHKMIIKACQKKDVTTAASLVEENWLSLGELLTKQTEKGE
ncbi:GntR family transcriptional regulator [Priestia megaterium]|nr:GntR family transcriptional regulator [Priestia megaterium]